MSYECETALGSANDRSPLPGSFARGTRDNDRCQRSPDPNK